MSWYELRLKPGSTPSEVYEALPRVSPAPILSTNHHFWDEPWWPDAYVVRVLAVDVAGLAALDAVDHIVAWDVGPDKVLFGEDWEHARAFFDAASHLSHVDEQSALKLVHCFLNTRGMSERDEARFAARLLWNRLTVKLKWRLYLRRRWERQQETTA